MSRPPSLASALTLSTIALASRTFLKLGSKSFHVEGLPILLDALKVPHDAKGKGRAVEYGTEPDEKQGDVAAGAKRRGIVTVCNHNSVVDDPMMWSLMPLSTYFPFASPTHTCRNTRWTLGASDIMFTKPLHSKFFDLGQVIETHRGGGIFQPAIDKAVKLLQDGSWIHIFPEGKVNQEKFNPDGGLLQFKWGVGRIIMDSTVMPEIIPLWISGFDQVMNEKRGWPRPVPRTGANISITVGQPLTSQIQPLVDAWRDMARKEEGTVGIGGDWEQERQGSGPAGNAQRDVRGKGALAEGREQDARMKICDVLREGVRRLGEDVERREGRFEKGLWSQSTSRT